MALLELFRSILSSSYNPKINSVDFSTEFEATIHRILDTLEKRFSEKYRVDALKCYIECCRQFGTGPIPDYLYWQVRKKDYANAIPATPELKGARDIAQKVSNLIDEVAYGAIEKDGLKKAERILQMVQTMVIKSDTHP